MKQKKVLALAMSLILVLSTSTFKSVKAASSLDNLYTNAYSATLAALQYKTQSSINTARAAIKLLPKELNWAVGEFSKQVDTVQQPIFVKAYNAIVTAQKTPNQANINAAYAAIDKDMADFFKNSYSSAVDKVQQNYMKKAVDAYKKANTSKLQADVDLANQLFLDIKTSNNPDISNWVDLAQIYGNINDLSDGGIHTGNYTITSAAGTYGSSSTYLPTTIKGNVLINNNYGSALVLQNMNIDGVLTINFGAGDVTLNNVNVNGVTITNIGQNSLHVTGNTIIKNLNVNDSNNDAHVVVEGNGTITNVNALSGVKLETASNSTNVKPYGNVTLSGANLSSDNSKVILDGVFNIVSITSPNAAVELQGSSIDTVAVSKDAVAAKINLPYDSNINKLNISAPITVTGSGSITTANIGATWTTIVPVPNNIAILASVTATVGGETRNASNTRVIPSIPAVTIPSTGTGSTGTGTGTGSTSIPVDGIRVSPSTYTLNGIGATTTLTAALSPSNATNRTVNWTSSDSTIATVDSNGRVTAVSPGTVSITATSAGSSVSPISATITVKASVAVSSVSVLDAYTIKVQSQMRDLAFNVASTNVYGNVVMPIENIDLWDGVYTITLRAPLSTNIEYQLTVSKPTYNDTIVPLNNLVKIKYITNISSLYSAMAAQSDGEIWYISPGTYNLPNQLTITKAITLKRDPSSPITPIIFKADTTSPWSNATDEQHLLAIFGGTASAPVNIENILIDASSFTEAVIVAHNANVKLQDVTIKNGIGAGLTINNSTVNAANLNTINNFYGAVNVDPGYGVTTPTVFNLSNPDTSISDLHETKKIWSEGIYAVSSTVLSVSAPSFTKYTIAAGTNKYEWIRDIDLNNCATITRNGKIFYYDTIGAAVAAAVSGDTINVARGIYTEQITIDSKNITIKGQIAANGTRATTINSPTSLALMNLPTSDIVRPIISVINSQSFAIKDIIIDGNSNGALNPGFAGVGVYNSTGEISNCEIKNINGSTNNGTGIFAVNNGTAQQLSANNNTISYYNNCGIAINGTNLKGNIVGNTITGQGAQNGVQFNASTYGTMQSNYITNNFIGILLNGAVHTGIMDFDILRNNPGVTGNSRNIVIQ